MKKRILSAILCLAVALTATAHAAEVPDSTVAMTLDGVPMEQCLAQGYGGVSYVSLGDMTLALRPDAALAWEDGQLVARAPDFFLTAWVGAVYLVVNGRYLYIPTGVKADEEGNPLVPVRTLAAALGAVVGWGGSLGVVLTSGGVPLAPGDTFYNATDLDLLSRVIMHESGNQPLAGKIAVGNVILNRTATDGFAGTISDVIYEKGQFPGATDATPNDESVLAAKLCLDGAVTAPGALYFNGAGKDCWAARNKALVVTIGGHAFYG